MNARAGQVSSSEVSLSMDDRVLFFIEHGGDDPFLRAEHYQPMVVVYPGLFMNRSAFFITHTWKRSYGYLAQNTARKSAGTR